MNAVCKFRCAEVDDLGCGSQDVRLDALYDENLPGDQRFAQYTPTGSMTMRITNPSLMGFFVAGESYLIEVSKP